MNLGMFGGNNNNTGAVVLLENGIQFSDLSIQNTAYIVSNSAIRNRIINGAMKIDQRNAGVAQAIVAAAALAYTVDRYYGFCTGANITGQRITLANAQNRYRLTGLAAVTSMLLFSNGVDMLPASNCTSPIVSVCVANNAPPVNTISIPVVAAAGIAICAL